NSEVTAINGDAKVESVDLHNVVDDTTSTLDVNGVFIAIGSDPRTDLVQGQLDINEVDGTIVVQEPSTKTKISGVFAAGDVVDGNSRHANTSAGMGANAALDVEYYLVEKPTVLTYHFQTEGSHTWRLLM